ncbi:hypothetical protein [Paenibacillus sp. BGI2013]|uniref:hypothetical protein n=1 Tax=Paenibacillus sp. BGI2013 TaxID=2058902 RepID=UPI00214CEA8A|nr:hypothetical protein [Paenibacillus sp. BGI2013]
MRLADNKPIIEPKAIPNMIHPMTEVDACKISLNSGVLEVHEENDITCRANRMNMDIFQSPMLIVCVLPFIFSITTPLFCSLYMLGIVLFFKAHKLQYISGEIRFLAVILHILVQYYKMAGG